MIILLLWTSTVVCVHEVDLDYVAHYASLLPESLRETSLSAQHTMRTFIQRIATALGFKVGSYFSANDFEKVIKKVLESRSTQYMQDRLVEKMVFPTGATCIVWGDLNGAFHSLVRDLLELNKQGSVTKEFVLADNHYYIFNGNVIGDRHYSLETFMLVMYLMYKNPQRVVYIKGAQEDKERWIDSVFAQQIKKFNVALGLQNYNVHTNQLRTFFNSLPLALYAFAPDHVEQDRKNVVRFSYYAPNYGELDESHFSYFFDSNSPSVISLLDKGTKLRNIRYQIVAYVCAEPSEHEYAHSKGLLLKTKKENMAYWTLVSSPMIKSHAQQDQFFNDAFVAITTAHALNAWTILLYYQDVRILKGFTADESYYLLTGNRMSDLAQDRLECKLGNFSPIKQQLHNHCFFNTGVLQQYENMLDFIKYSSWSNLFWMGELLSCC